MNKIIKYFLSGFALLLGLIFIGLNIYIAGIVLYAIAQTTIYFWNIDKTQFLIGVFVFIFGIWFVIFIFTSIFYDDFKKDFLPLEKDQISRRNGGS